MFVIIQPRIIRLGESARLKTKYHHDTCRPVSGNLKLIRAGQQNAWELFDVSKDRTEQHNLADEQPEKVKELSQQWREWAQRVHALPFPKKAPKGNKQNKKAQKSAKADAVES
jgi:arylsulfatase A-like enzyme